MCNLHTVCRWERSTVVHCYKAARMGLCDKPLNNSFHRFKQTDILQLSPTVQRFVLDLA
jgi:hypothetical protein